MCIAVSLILRQISSVTWKSCLTAYSLEVLFLAETVRNIPTLALRVLCVAYPLLFSALKSADSSKG